MHYEAVAYATYSLTLLVLFCVQKKIPVLLLIVVSMAVILPVPRLLFYNSTGFYGMHFTGVNSAVFFKAMTIYSTSFLILIATNIGSKDPFQKYMTNLSTNQKAYVLLVLLVFGLMAIELIFGSAWHHSQRSVSISSTIPALRYFYPAMLFAAAVGLITACKLLLFYPRKMKWGVAFFFIALLVFSLIGQRGIMITLLASTALLLRRCKIINSIHLFGALLTIGLYAVFGRLIVTGDFNFNSIFRTLTTYIAGGDGTQIGSLAYTLKYVASNGTVNTVPSELLTIIPHTTRMTNGISTTSDILNYSLLGEAYLSTGFGYNFTNICILVMNFGEYLALFFYFILSLLVRLTTNIFVRWNVGPLILMLYYLNVQFLTTGIGSIHWIVYFSLMILLVAIFEWFLVSASVKNAG